MEMKGQLDTPATLPLGKNAFYSLERRLGEARACLYAVVKRKISCPC
jgi:hypothetical protein